MKKFAILQFIVTIIVIAVSLVSCATTKTFITETHGDIQLLNYDGQPIRVWNNSMIESETTSIVSIMGSTASSTYDAQRGFKLSGALNFKDEDGICHFINGGIIIIDNLYSVTKPSDGDTYNDSDTDSQTNDQFKKLKVDYLLCKAQIESNKERMKTIEKNGDEYKVLVEQNKRMRGKMVELQRSAYDKGYGDLE